MNRRWRCAQFFELWWWKNYLTSRSKSEYLRWKQAYWRDFLQKSGVELPAAGRVLDAGCGPAGIFILLAGDYSVDAVDPLLEQYALRLPHFRPEDYPGIRFYAQPIEHITPNHSYEVIFCLNAINHVADLNRALDRLTGLLAPGGVLCLSVDAHRYTWLKRLFQWIPADILHPHQYACAEYVRMLETRNMRVDPPLLLKSHPVFNYYLLVARRREQA